MKVRHLRLHGRPNRQKRDGWVLYCIFFFFFCCSAVQGRDASQLLWHHEVWGCFGTPKLCKENPIKILKTTHFVPQICCKSHICCQICTLLANSLNAHLHNKNPNLVCFLVKLKEKKTHTFKSHLTKSRTRHFFFCLRQKTFFLMMDEM